MPHGSEIGLKPHVEPAAAKAGEVTVQLIYRLIVIMILAFVVRGVLLSRAGTSQAVGALVTIPLILRALMIK